MAANSSIERTASACGLQPPLMSNVRPHETMKMPPRALMLVALVGLAASVCFAQSSQYDIKDRDPPTGSNIRRNITEGSRIPINKTYSELSPEEKEAINRYYEKIEPGDEPPFPAEGLRPIHNAVAAAQQTLLVTGQLV